MKYQFFSLLLLMSFFVIGCGSSNDEAPPALSQTDTQQVESAASSDGDSTTERNGEKAAQRSSVQTGNPNSDLDTKPIDEPKLAPPTPITEILGELGEDNLEEEFQKLATTGEEVHVSGVIVKLDAYKKKVWGIEPTIFLDSGIPASTEDYASTPVICVFEELDELQGLKFGQKISLVGKFEFHEEWGRFRPFKITDCKVTERLTDPAIVSFPKHSSDEIRLALKSEDELEEKLDTSGVSVNTSIGAYWRIEIPPEYEGDDDQIPENTMSLIKEIPVLQQLQLGFLDSTSNSIAEDAGALPYCEELIIYCQDVKKSGVQSTLSIPGLQKIRLEDIPDWGPDTLSVLSKSPMLRTLVINGPSEEMSLVEKGDEFFSHLKNTPELRELQLANVGLTDEGLNVLDRLPYVRKLSLYNTKCNGSGLRHLKNPGNLWFLDLSGESIDDNLADSLPLMTNLRNLYLRQNSIDFSTDSRVGNAFRSLTNLEILLLRSNQIDNDIGIHLTKVSSLKELIIESENVTDEFQLPVESLPKLSRIWFQKTRIGSNVCKQIGRCRTLTHITLNGANITDDDVSAIIGDPMTSLIERIELQNTNITEVALEKLLEVKSLTGVTVSRSLEISDEVYSQFTTRFGDKKKPFISRY